MTRPAHTVTHIEKIRKQGAISAKENQAVPAKKKKFCYMITMLSDEINHTSGQ